MAQVELFPLLSAKGKSKSYIEGKKPMNDSTFFIPNIHAHFELLQCKNKGFFNLNV